MAMPDVPRTDRQLVNLPEVRTFRSDAGAAWGSIGDAAGRSLAGIGDGLAAFDRARKLKIAAADREDENQASLLASKYSAHCRERWNGYMSRDADGREVRVPGVKDKTYLDYQDGTTTLTDLERIDADFRDGEEYQKLSAGARKKFEQKIQPCRREMMQAAQSKAYADGIAKGKAEHEFRTEERSQQVGSTFGGDDAAYGAASEVCSNREALDTFGQGEVMNRDELDGMDSFTVEDVRFRNDPNGEKAKLFQTRVSRIQDAYDKSYFDALTSSATNAQPLGQMSPEQCVEKAREFARHIGRNDTERAKLLAVVESANERLKAHRSDERSAAVAAYRKDATRRESEYWSSGPQPATMPSFYNGEAAKAEQAGDFERSVVLRKRAREMDDALKERNRQDALRDRQNRRAKEELDLYTASGNSPSAEDLQALHEKWQKEDAESDPVSALSSARAASKDASAAAAGRAREREALLDSNYEDIQWMLVDEQNLRAHGRTEEANLLRNDIAYRLNLLKTQRGLRPAAAKAFEADFNSSVSTDTAAFMQVFDRAFDMNIDANVDGNESAQELNEFRNWGGEYRPAWAKGAGFDALLRLRLRREYLNQLSALPPEIDRKAAASEILKQFQVRYAQQKYSDQIEYMASLFGDLRTANRSGYAKVRDRREADEAKRVQDVQGAYSPASAEADAERTRAQQNLESAWKADGGGSAPAYGFGFGL